MKKILLILALCAISLASVQATPPDGAFRNLDVTGTAAIHGGMFNFGSMTDYPSLPGVAFDFPTEGQDSPGAFSISTRSSSDYSQGGENGEDQPAHFTLKAGDFVGIAGSVLTLEAAWVDTSAMHGGNIWLQAGGDPMGIDSVGANVNIQGGNGNTGGNVNITGGVPAVSTYGNEGWDMPGGSVNITATPGYNNGQSGVITLNGPVVITSRQGDILMGQFGNSGSGD